MEEEQKNEPLFDLDDEDGTEIHVLGRNERGQLGAGHANHVSLALSSCSNHVVCVPYSKLHPLIASQHMDFSDVSLSVHPWISHETWTDNCAVRISEITLRGGHRHS